MLLGATPCSEKSSWELVFHTRVCSGADKVGSQARHFLGIIETHFHFHHSFELAGLKRYAPLKGGPICVNPNMTTEIARS